MGRERNKTPVYIKDKTKEKIFYRLKRKHKHVLRSNL